MELINSNLYTSSPCAIRVMSLNPVLSKLKQCLKYDICGYVNLSIVLGVDFDQTISCLKKVKLSKNSCDDYRLWIITSHLLKKNAIKLSSEMVKEYQTTIFKILEWRFFYTSVFECEDFFLKHSDLVNVRDLKFMMSKYISASNDIKPKKLSVLQVSSKFHAVFPTYKFLVLCWSCKSDVKTEGHLCDECLKCVCPRCLFISIPLVMIDDCCEGCCGCSQFNDDYDDYDDY